MAEAGLDTGNHRMALMHRKEPSTLQVGKERCPVQRAWQTAERAHREQRKHSSVTESALRESTCGPTACSPLEDTGSKSPLVRAVWSVHAYPETQAKKSS